MDPNKSFSLEAATIFGDQIQNGNTTFDLDAALFEDNTKNAKAAGTRSTQLPDPSISKKHMKVRRIPPRPKRRFGSDEAKELTEKIRQREKLLRNRDLTVCGKWGREQGYLYAYEPVTDDGIATGALENRPCRNTFSRVHRVDCGHIVYCKTVQVCGKNCRGAQGTEVAENMMLHCTLCSRSRIAWEKRHFNNRWQDLLLPIFMSPAEEAADLKEFADVTRRTAPAYIDPDGILILPTGHIDGSLVVNTAMIRAWEWQKENSLKTQFPLVCETILDWPGKTATTALEYFDQILRHYQRVRHTNMRLVATMAIALAGRDVVARPNVLPILKFFETELDEEYYNNATAASELVDHLIALDKIEDFMSKAPSKYRTARNFGKVEVVARRIRAKFLETRALRNEAQKRALRVHVVAACIQQAMAQYKIAIEMKTICEVLGIDYDQDAIYAEGKVSSFARRTDFTRKGKLKDERKKEQKAKAKAERDTAGLADCLTGL
jgi:hypothetical protein